MLLLGEKGTLTIADADREVRDLSPYELERAVSRAPEHEAK